MVNERKDPEGPAAAIWVIEKTRHFRDVDNYQDSESSIELDEGFYLSKEAAEQHAEEFNTALKANHEHIERQRQLEHEGQNKAVLRHNSEADAIRAAGMKKSDIPLPLPFKPKTFAEFMRNTDHTIYEAVEIEHAPDDLLPTT